MSYYLMLMPPTNPYPTWPIQEEQSMEPRPAHRVVNHTPTRPKTERKSYRPREIAEMHGVALSTVYADIYAGRLRSNRRGRSHLVPVDAIDEWLSSAAAS